MLRVFAAKLRVDDVFIAPRVSWTGIRRNTQREFELPRKRTRGKNMKRLLLSVAVILAFNTMPAFAKLPTVKLKCGKLPNYKIEAEREYMSREAGGGDNGLYNVFITFIAKKPENKQQMDKILRECVAEAIKMDGSKDISANAMYRKKQGDNPYEDDLINVYGPMEYLLYAASTKSISIHKLEPLHK